MNNLMNPEDKKPSNCVSHHDDICFADHNHNDDKEDQN